jgi:hypothetical protein
MSKVVKKAVYYDYEGETVIITKDDSNPECITIQTYDSSRIETKSAMTFITMLYSEWQQLVKQVEDL